jgi:hypothetical protein
VPPSDTFVRFYNPRTDDWHDHFKIVGARIEGISPIGEATVVILGMNRPDRVKERELLQVLGLYPHRPRVSGEGA